MKVGDYVRIRDDLGKQYIGKIYNINEFREPNMKYAIDCQIFNDFVFIGEERIVKSSPKIINLIQVGDYVNGEKVCYLKGQINEKEVAHKEDVLYTEYVDEYGEWYGYEEDEIESIVTREQFSQMEYKVKE